MANVPANVAGQPAGREPIPAPEPVAILDHQLIMAARRGKLDQLKDLLGLIDDDEQAGTVDSTALSVAAGQQFIVDVHRQPTAAAAATRLLGGVTRIERDTLLHVIAASGDGEEFLNCARMIYNNNKGLLVKPNKKKETPLHCAAGVGNTDMVSCLIDLAVTTNPTGGETSVKEFVEMRNERGETALHQAVRAASKASIDELMSVGPELACIPHDEDEEGHTTSPLYLAISLGKEEIARHLIHKSNHKLSCSGPDGRNILHAAVSRGQALPNLLEWLKDEMVDIQEGDRRVSVRLVSHLTEGRDRKTGSTPLHLAVSLAGWPLYMLFLGPRPPIAPLLDANTCAAYLTDNQGLYPIHVAAKNRLHFVVKELLQMCPDCATLRDAKGRTFVHVAVEKESFCVVEYACRQMPPWFSTILNLQDNNGDTALHRAIDVGNLRIFNSLIQNRHICLDIPNNEGLTPRDISQIKITTKFYYDWNPRNTILYSLVLLGAPHGESRRDLFSEEHIFVPDNNNAQEDKLSQDLTNATQVMGLVSVLVATVTFASAFTLPGGFKTDGDVAGTPVLAGSYYFDAFILAVTWAFICSCVATCSLVFAGLASVDLSIRKNYFDFASFLVLNAVRSLGAAFALGLYLVLAPVAKRAAITVMVISSTGLLFGNIGVWEIIGMAITACRRGMPPPIFSGCAYVLLLSGWVLVHYFPFIVIFVVPTIIGRSPN